MSEAPLPAGIFGDPAEDDVVVYLMDVSERIRELQAEADAARAWLAARLEPGTYRLAGLKVNVFRARRFDPKKAASVLPAQWIPRISRFEIDAALARALLPEELFAACQVEGKRTVRLS